jgi:hypothetical protein
MIRSWITFEHGKHFWQRWFLKQGYGHLYIIQDITDTDSFILLVPLYNDLRIVFIKSEDKEEMLITKVRCAYYIEKAERLLGSSFHLRLINPFTCVGIAKYYFGIRRWWIITPWQLAKYLEKIRKGKRKEKLIMKVKRVK